MRPKRRQQHPYKKNAQSQWEIAILPFRCVTPPLCHPSPPLLALPLSLRASGAVVRAQGLWNSREEGKWVSMEACKMNREEGIR